MSGVSLVEIRAEDGEQRLDRWLRRRFPGLTQGRIEKLLRKGEGIHYRLVPRERYDYTPERREFFKTYADIKFLVKLHVEHGSG